MNLCTSCKLDFGSVSAFDAHRVGRHEYLYREGLDFDPPVYDGRRCLDEEEIEALVNPKTGKPVFARNSFGNWSLTRALEDARTASWGE